MTSNTHEILRAKIFALKSYDFLVEQSKETKKVNPNQSRGIAKAQITIWAGIYNRDYKEYRKGVDTFKQLTDEEKTKQGKNTLNLKMRAATEGSDEIEFISYDNSTVCNWFDDKHEYYKNLYNELPRGYFKKK